MKQKYTPKQKLYIQKNKELFQVGSVFNSYDVNLNESEEHLGRYLTKKEVIHHLDFDKANNKIENLHLFADMGKHHSYHLRLQSLVNRSLLGKKPFDNKSYMKEYRLGKRRKRLSK